MQRPEITNNNDFIKLAMDNVGVREYIPEKDRNCHFMDICNQMMDTYTRKNADYGDSFSKLYEKFGLKSTVIRLSDKINRLESLDEAKQVFVVDESIDDTLMDLANYAIMTLIERRMKNNK